MTTVAADFSAGLMVADSRTNISDVWVESLKIERMGDALIGHAGMVSTIDKAMVYIKSGRRGKAPSFTGIALLVLRPSGLFVMSDEEHEVRIETGRFAIGSGGACALAAMKAGADVEQAVRIACEVDQNSGPPVRVYSLDGSRNG